MATEHKDSKTPPEERSSPSPLQRVAIVCNQLGILNPGVIRDPIPGQVSEEHKALRVQLEGIIDTMPTTNAYNEFLKQRLFSGKDQPQRDSVNLTWQDAAKIYFDTTAEEGEGIFDPTLAALIEGFIFVQEVVGIKAYEKGFADYGLAWSGNKDTFFHNPMAIKMRRRLKEWAKEYSEKYVSLELNMHQMALMLIEDMHLESKEETCEYIDYLLSES